MKTDLQRALAAGSLFLAFATGCRSVPATGDSHWNIDSVPSRIVKQFTGYRGGADGSYLDYQDSRKKDLNLTFRRHFLNNNPHNPMQPYDPSQTGPRHPHSILPDPLYYFHIAPHDAIIASFTDGGGAEFWDGISNTFSGDWGEDELEPPPTRKFKVKNR